MKLAFWFRHLLVMCLLSLGMLATAPAYAGGSGTLADPYTTYADAYRAPSSGVYYFSLGSGTFKAYVDTSEGGGWIMVLNYVHKANTQPALRVITAAGQDLPLLGSSTLGTDESASTTTWGHAGNAVMNQFQGDFETRWYGRTSAHSRVIHFSTTVGDAYLRTGTGSVSGIASGFTLLTGGTAGALPSGANSYTASQGNLAMTYFPFYAVGARHWGIGAVTRWEVDDINYGTADTIHRVFIRSANAPPVTVPDASKFCRVSDGVNHGTGVPSIFWDGENAGATGAGVLRQNNVPTLITGTSIVTPGPGVTVTNNGNSVTLSSVAATTTAEARGNGEYVQFSFTMASTFSGYMENWATYQVNFSKFAIDVATQSDFSDAVNYYDGNGDLTAGWTRETGKGRLLLEAGKTYYVRLYVAGTASALIDGWGFDLGSCMDYGDIPIGTAAFHTQTGTWYLGATIPDIELKSQHTANGGANGTGDGADEDGVTFPALTQGGTQNILVVVNQPTANSGHLQGWIDWNNDGDFADAGEQIATDLQLASGTSGTITIPVTVPVIGTGGATYARFRWSSATGLTSSNVGPDGEIEDYNLTVLPASPNIQLTKASAVWDPGAANLLAVPGNDVYYAITITNSGAGQIDSGTLFIVDPVPSNLDFYLGDADGAGAGTAAVVFSQNASSALTFNAATDLAFATGTTPPTSFASCNTSFTAGYNSNIRYICIRPGGTLPGNITPASEATFSFRARIK